jgi:hypothetical protein
MKRHVFALSWALLPWRDGAALETVAVLGIGRLREPD